MTEPWKLVGLLVAILLSLTACGADDGAAGGDGRGFNDADVEFASTMIPHHAQALMMVDMTLGRPLDPKVQALAEDIRAAQAPEIETMVDWLQAWGKPVPETPRDHANAHGDGMEMNSEVPGMMSSEDMQALEHADGEQFQRMWLEMMIEHHRGAIEIAQAELEGGQFAPAIKLAERIEAAQEAQIATMQDLLGP